MGKGFTMKKIIFLLTLLLTFIHNNSFSEILKLNDNHVSNKFFIASLFEDSTIYQDTTTFTDINAHLFGGYFSSVVWGDYDNDGDLDLLINGSTDYDSMYTIIYRNDNGTFVDIKAPLIGVQSAHSESWVDYDNDGDLDLIIQGATGPNNFMPITKIYRNDNGTFVDINADLPGCVYGSTSWGDYDNDGDLDLLLTGSPDGGMSFISKIFRNDNGTFIDIQAGLPGVWGSSSSWVDFDCDGDLDISLCGYGDWGVTNAIFRNDNGIFTNINANLALVNSGAMAWGDYDNDGDPDLLITGMLIGGGGPFTTIYRNDNGNFVDINPKLVNVMGSAVAWGDYDNDGQLDIIIAGATKFNPGKEKLSMRQIMIALSQGGGPYISEPITKIYRNNNGVFTDLNVRLPRLHNCSIAWGDFDNDGDLDIALTGGTSLTTESKPYLPITSIYRNNLGSNIYSKNLAPSIPENLSVSIINNNIIFTWDKATDDHTPQNGLYYNLRLGITENGSEIISTISNPLTGYQRVPKIMTAHNKNQWIIKNLPIGTYYWSVQSIDKGYA